LYYPKILDDLSDQTGFGNTRTDQLLICCDNCRYLL